MMRYGFLVGITMRTYCLSVPALSRETRPTGQSGYFLRHLFQGRHATRAVLRSFRRAILFTPIMADIQFEEERFERQVPPVKKSFFTKLVLSTGIVSTDKDAQYVLVGFAVLMLALAFLIPLLFGSSPSRAPQGDAGALVPAPNPR